MHSVRAGSAVRESVVGRLAGLKQSPGESIIPEKFLLNVVKFYLV